MKANEEKAVKAAASWVRPACPRIALLPLSGRRRADAADLSRMRTLADRMRRLVIPCPLSGHFLAEGVASLERNLFLTVDLVDNVSINQSL